MRWTWKRIPEGVLDPERQLGGDVGELVARGEFAEVHKRLLRWQRTIGRTGDKVGRKLAAVCAQQSVLGTAGSSSMAETAYATLEETRVKLAASLVPVTRAYLLSTRFVFKHYWMLDDFGQARWVYAFLVEARKFGKEHALEVGTAFQSPIRSVGSLGWTGSANLRCVGTAGELQQFVQEVCRLAFVGLEPGSLRGAFMEEIPTYAQARAAEGYVQLVDAQLFPELPGSVAAERRDRDEAMQRSLNELRELTARIAGGSPLPTTP